MLNHGRHEFHVCLCCGLSVCAGVTGPVHTKLVSFAAADLVRETRTTVEERYRVTSAARYALEFPGRHSREELEGLFSHAPWSVEEVLRHSRRDPASGWDPAAYRARR